MWCDGCDVDVDEPVLDVPPQTLEEMVKDANESCVLFLGEVLSSIGLPVESTLPLGMCAVLELRETKSDKEVHLPDAPIGEKEEPMRRGDTADSSA